MILRRLNASVEDGGVVPGGFVRAEEGAMVDGEVAVDGVDIYGEEVGEKERKRGKHEGGRKLPLQWR
jgi:hypothetical protein